MPSALHFSASDKCKGLVHKSAAKCSAKGKQIHEKATGKPGCSHRTRQLVRKNTQHSLLPGCMPPLGSHHMLTLRKVSSMLLGNLAGISTHIRVSKSRRGQLRGPTAGRAASTSLGPISKYPRREGPGAAESSRESRS